MSFQKDQLRTSSFSMPLTMYKEFCDRLPQYGDRTKVLVELVRMFLKKEVKVTLPGKTF